MDVKSRLKDIKYWLDYHFEAVVGVSVISIFIGLICFFAVPVKGTMIVEKTKWCWAIPVYEYSVHEENQWNSAPDGAYDISKSREIHHWDTVVDSEWTDNNGNKHQSTHDEPVYRWKYYYKINKWDFIQDICSVGFDKKPYEAECNLEFNVVNAKIGDRKRGEHKEEYQVFGNIGSGKDIWYDLDKSDWEKIEIGGKISFKKFRFGSKIWDISFGNGMRSG